MNLINEFLKTLSLEQRELLYTASNLTFWIAFGIVLTLYIRKSHKLSVLQTVGVFVIPFAVNYVIVFIAGLIKTAAAPIVEIPTYYPVYFLPILYSTVTVICPVVRLGFREVADKFLLSYFIARPFHCIACLLYGCCNGGPAEWGIYSGVDELAVVPLRAFEIILVLVAWGVHHWLYIHGKFTFKGECAAIGSIVFGVLLALFDVLCTNPDPVFLIFSAVGISALITVAAGIIMLTHYAMKEKKRRIRNEMRKNRRKSRSS